MTRRIPEPGQVGSPHRPRAVTSLLGAMLVVSTMLGVVVSGLALPLVGLAGFTTRTVAGSMDKLPQALQTKALPQRTVILDASGEPIATIYDENRINVSLSEVSRTMVKALLAIEDYRFYEHGALDLRGTIRSLLTNHAADAVVQGGSSITQQLVKLTLLNQAKTRKQKEAATADTYARKLRELRYAIALEERHSKDWILERYLNTAYFGDGAYGIQAAAQHYFNVSAEHLNVRQSAMLAGLVQSPDAFDPTNDPTRSKQRRNVVLNRMAELGIISPRKAAITRRLPLGLDVQPKRNDCIDSTAQFFCDYVLAYLMRDPALGDSPDERLDLIRTGGLTIQSTLDSRMQAAAQDSVSAHVYAGDEAVGALALVEPRSGEVKALAQSRPMGAQAGQGATFLNYTVPKEYGGASGFQSGSTFKAFVLAVAINQGIPLTTAIASPARGYFPENTFDTCDGPYPSTGVWDVKNLDGRSHTGNLYTGTQLSLNTFYAELERRTGLCEPWRLAKRMGVTLADPERFMVPSFTLGIVDVSPLEMAEAYATFAARGRHCDATPVTRIEDAGGRLLKQYRAECSQVLPRPVADAVNDVLRGVVAPGGFGEALYPGQPAAGKTGTTTANTAVWFAGYTPNLAGVAAVAGVDEEGNPESLDYKSVGGTTLYTSSGSTTAGPIWGDAFQTIAPLIPDTDFTTPPFPGVEPDSP